MISAGCMPWSAETGWQQALNLLCLGEEIKMDNKQKINCTVESCKYNNQNKKICELNAIMVTPKQNVNSENPDESECSSYECK